MAVTITPDEVKEIIPTTSSCDIVQCYINSMNAKVGDCIDNTYDPSTAKLIKLNLVAYQIAVNEDVQDVTSKKAPNGASVTYSQSSNNGSGIMSNKYGRTVYNLDTNMCWKGIVKSNIAFGTVGQTNRKRTKRLYR
jgi:hypothetical protein